MKTFKHSVKLLLLTSNLPYYQSGITYSTPSIDDYGANPDLSFGSSFNLWIGVQSTGFR